MVDSDSAVAVLHLIQGTQTNDNSNIQIINSIQELLTRP